MCIYLLYALFFLSSRFDECILFLYFHDFLNQRNFAHNRGVLFAISFFGWLAFCALFQFVCYIDQRRIWKKTEQGASEEEGDDEEEEDPHLFSEELVPYDMDLSAAGERRDATVGEVGLNEPFLPGGERNSGTNHSSGLRSFMPSYRGSSATASIFMYQSGEREF